MGYTASGYGVIELQKTGIKYDQEFDNFLDKHTDTFGMFCGCFMVEWESDNSIRLVHDCDWNYHYEDVEAALELLAPYTKSGDIEFCGEDDCHWKYAFKNGKFVEYNGRIVYEDEEE